MLQVVRGIYTVTFENGTLATASGDYDIFTVTPADDEPVAILGFEFDNVGGTADAGDAQEELLRLAFIRGHTSPGTGGASATPVALDPRDETASFTARTMDTAIGTGGSTVTPWAGGWNNRITGPIELPRPILVTQANTSIVLRCLSTAADDLSVSGTLWCQLV